MSTIAQAFKQWMIRGGLKALQVYYRYLPVRSGKMFVWNHIARPYFLWRPLTLETTTIFGARLHLQLPDSIQNLLYVFGVWEPVITAYLMRTLMPGDVVIDIGANIGYDTLLASGRVGGSGHVYAFEASPRIHVLLERNLRSNHCANVTAFNVAVSDAECDVPIYLEVSGNLGGSTIVPTLAAQREARLEETVRGAPLGSLLPESTIAQARLIKIDVEGAEWLVVKGMAPLLPRLSPRTQILVEVNAEALREHDVTPAAFVQLFTDAGFVPYVLENRYTVDMYIEPAVVSLVPLDRYDFDQLDLLFVRPQ